MTGWNPHWGCHLEALRPLNIPLKLKFGCWWEHGISDALDECRAIGVDWVLTLDYDSMFSSKHVNDLI
jgi:hypothetical protein